MNTLHSLLFFPILLDFSWFLSYSLFSNKRREILSMWQQDRWSFFMQSNLIVVFENVLIKAFGKRGLYCILMHAVAQYGMPSSWFPGSKTYLFWLKFHLLWETFITGRFISSLFKALGDIFLTPLPMINILCNISSFSNYFHPWHAGELRTGCKEAPLWTSALTYILRVNLSVGT